MANKGSNKHIKRLASGNYIRVSRKTSAYVTKPMPGRHPLEVSISIGTVLREKLHAAATLHEVELMLQQGFVKVNGKEIKTHKYPVGFGDIITLEPSKETYSVTVAKHGAFAAEKTDIKKERIYKVLGKYVAKKGKVMIRLDNGDIMDAPKGVNVNDSISIKDGKHSNTIKMEAGKKCFVVKGAHSSESGTIKVINQGTATRAALVSITGKAGEFETLLENIMVTG